MKKARTIRLGMAGYVRILAAMRDKPHMKSELVTAGLCGRVASSRIIGSLHHLGRIHIAEWRGGFRRAYRPAYGYGPGPDVPRPASRPNGREAVAISLGGLTLSPEVVALESLMRALAEPMTKTDLMEATGLSFGGLKRALDALRQHKFARIAGYEYRDHYGPQRALYQLGGQPDAKRPPAASKSIRNRRYNQRRKERKAFAPLAEAMNQPIFNLARSA